MESTVESLLSRPLLEHLDSDARKALAVVSSCFTGDVDVTDIPPEAEYGTGQIARLMSTGSFHATETLENATAYGSDTES